MDTLADIKRRLRKLKHLERRIRFPDSEFPKGVIWVYDSYLSKYSLHTLSQMNREEYKKITDEFFARVYYEFYKEKGIQIKQAYDPSLLEYFGLPFDAASAAVRKRFRELAKEYHPDAGGDAARFIELMRVYEELI
jgi:hypothetical protein